MARAARTPKAAAPAEAAPAEPDLLPGFPAPREANGLSGHQDAMAKITRTFASAPPQALLLEGPRGIGKATLAFRLARALLSAPPGTPLPEDLASDAQSRAARQIAAGTHPGLLHMTRSWDTDKKRFRTELTVETVRQLVPFLGGTAAGGGWRVVVVDAVDDTNASAANALLKALEEPPRLTLFLLVAHVAGRVMPTIRSRCRTVRLRPLADVDVAEALSRLGADVALAPAGEGSVRRALSFALAGSDVFQATRRLLDRDALSDLRNHHALADLGAQRKEGQFAAVVDLIFDALAERARSAADDAAVAARYASAYLAAAEERHRVEIFNLDQREYVLSLAARVAAADRAALTKSAT